MIQTEGMQIDIDRGKHLNSFWQLLAAFDMTDFDPLPTTEKLAVI